MSGNVSRNVADLLMQATFRAGNNLHPVETPDLDLVSLGDTLPEAAHVIAAALLIAIDTEDPL